MNLSKSTFDRIGLLSRDGVRGQGETVKEEEPMESKSRNEGGNLPDGGPMIQRCVIVHRDEHGFGFTVGGDNPVLVENVRLNGAAYRAGVRKHDRIVKVNGSQVLNCNHTEVVKLIKSGSYVALTLLGRQPVAAAKALDTLEQSTPIGTPTTPSLVQEKGKISSPLAVDHDKDLQFKAQRITTIQLMYKQVFEEYERMKIEYQKNPSEILQEKLKMKLQMVHRVEDQLRTIDSNHSMLSSAPSMTSQPSSAGDSLPPSRPPPSKRPSAGLNVVSGDKSESPDVVSQLPSFLHRGPKPWLPSVPQHRKSASMSDFVSKKESKASDAAAEDADVEMVTASVMGTPAVESSRVPLSSASSDPLSVTSQDVSSHEAVVDSEVPPSANLQQPLKVSVLKPSLKVISPNQVKVVVMEDSGFMTVTYSSSGFC